MRVTHLGKFYPPVPGGMERVLQLLCEGERALGVDSRALVLAEGAATVDDIVNDVPVTRAAALLKVGSVSISLALILRVRREHCDALVLHEPNPMALLAFALARPRVPLVVWYHSEVIRPRWRYRAFYHPFVTLALRRAVRIVTSSPALLEQAAALAPYRERAAVIPFGLPEPTSTRASSWTSAVRERWDGPIVLFVGRLVPYKGVQFLLRALQELRAAAVIVGDGPLRHELELEASGLGMSERVFFLGSLPNEALDEWYRTCDVLALPSTTAAEAFGLVQLEAMARGTPVVSTRVPSGVPWVNQDGVTGYTVPPGNPEALRTALSRILADDDLRTRMGEAARRRFADHFTQRRMVEETKQMYEEVCWEAAQPVTAPSNPSALAHATPRLKRAFDVMLSALGLVLSAPVWLVAAALIKLEDGGPILYRQERVGAGGRTFTVLKFRSMVADAERESGPLQAIEGDPRVTKIGRLLRATAMDELPQLVNIFRGDMSFVGPRALRPGEVESTTGGRFVALEEVDGYHARAAVQPGLTGIAQIYAPRDVARRQKFRYDRVYVRRRSFGLDLRLILLSFWISLRGTWENRERKY